jgi:signal transduction histidine kinase
MQETPHHHRREVLSTSFRAPTSQGNGVVQTTVRDFRTGFSEKVRQRIFEHFFSTKKDGLGMGLAIARSIVESFGGVLDATSATGGGAIFHFSLPALH